MYLYSKIIFLNPQSICDMLLNILGLMKKRNSIFSPSFKIKFLTLNASLIADYLNGSFIWRQFVRVAVSFYNVHKPLVNITGYILESVPDRHLADGTLMREFVIGVPLNPS